MQKGMQPTQVFAIAGGDVQVLVYNSLSAAVPA